MHGSRALLSLAAATAAVPEVLVVYPPPHRTHYLFANKLRVRVALLDRAAAPALAAGRAEMCVALEGATSLVGCQPLAPAGAQSFLAAVDHVPAGPYTVDAWVARGEGGGRRPGREACGGRVVIGGAEARLCDLAPEGPSCDDPRATSLGATLAGHDATFAVTIGGRVAVALELERLFGRRYYRAPEDLDVWEREIHAALAAVRPPGNFTAYDYGVLVSDAPNECGPGGGWWPMDDDVWFARRLALERLAPALAWAEVDHHATHATLAAFDAPWPRSVVATYDAGGNDGCFNIYRAARRRGGALALARRAALGRNLGHAYRLVGLQLPEVNRSWQPVPRRAGYGPDWRHAAYQAVTGKLMGYKALGRVRDEWRAPLRQHYERCVVDDAELAAARGAGTEYFASLDVWTRLNHSARSSPAGPDAQDQRDLAATAQLEFEEAVLRGLDAQVMAAHGDVDGLAVAGGGALNVLLNERLARRYGLPVYVPAAPHDGGLAVGAAWRGVPPAADAGGARQPLQYVGARAWDRRATASILSGGTRATPESLAALLAAAPHPIVAVFRGRQEFGPRALVHRSLIAAPVAGMKDRMNRLKRREWYRPVAPTVALEHMLDLFEAAIPSPYMSFAPILRPDAARTCPAVAHFDNTSRPQTVSATDEPWVHALLLALRDALGAAVVINTSFNVRGKPIINSHLDAIELLRDEPELDYLLLEDRLLAKAEVAEWARPTATDDAPARALDDDDVAWGPWAVGPPAATGGPKNLRGAGSLSA